MSKQAEESYERIINEEIDKNPQFMDQVRYHNYLTEIHIHSQDCSNQFAYEGDAQCPQLCEHVRAVADGMVEKFGE